LPHLDENEIGTYIVDLVVRIHRQVGPGLLESVYEVILAFELSNKGLEV
jgi:GxxExxY protein